MGGSAAASAALRRARLDAGGAAGASALSHASLPSETAASGTAPLLPPALRAARLAGGPAARTHVRLALTQQAVRGCGRTGRTRAFVDRRARDCMLGAHARGRRGALRPTRVAAAAQLGRHAEQRRRLRLRGRLREVGAGAARAAVECASIHDACGPLHGAPASAAWRPARPRRGAAAARPHP